MEKLRIYILILSLVVVKAGFFCDLRGEVSDMPIGMEDHDGTITIEKARDTSPYTQ